MRLVCWHVFTACTAAWSFVLSAQLQSSRRGCRFSSLLRPLASILLLLFALAPAGVYVGRVSSGSGAGETALLLRAWEGSLEWYIGIPAVESLSNPCWSS